MKFNVMNAKYKRMFFTSIISNYVINSYLL